MENDLVPVKNNVVSGTGSTSTFGQAAGGETTRDFMVFVRVSNSFLCYLRAVFPLSLPCVRDTVDNVDGVDIVDGVGGLDLPTSNCIEPTLDSMMLLALLF